MMAIVRFNVDNQIMTINLQDMSTSATTANTKVSIGGAAQSNPTLVSPVQQRIQLPLASTSKAKGIVTVIVTPPTGHAEKTASVEAYIPEEVDPTTIPPVIKGSDPLIAQPGITVTLTGQHMRSITTIFLGDNSITPVTTSDATAKFQVPKIKTGRYQILYQGPHVPKTKSTLTLQVNNG